MGDVSNKKSQVATTKSEKKNLFILPNGNYLRYECLRRGRSPGKQDKWEIGYDLPFFWERSRLTRKESKPKLGLWSSHSRQHLICADFDKEPPEFKTPDKTFDTLYNYLQDKYGSKGIILRSSSNKAKALFLIEKDSLKLPTNKEAIDCLERIDPFLAKYADKQGAALSVTFVNEQMAKIISVKLPTLPIIQRIASKKNEPRPPLKAEKNRIQKKTGMIFYGGEFPPRVYKFINHYKSKSARERERFIRFILGIPKLALKEIAIPITTTSSYVGTSKKKGIPTFLWDAERRAI